MLCLPRLALILKSSPLLRPRVTDPETSQNMSRVRTGAERETLLREFSKSMDDYPHMLGHVRP